MWSSAKLLCHRMVTRSSASMWWCVCDAKRLANEFDRRPVSVYEDEKIDWLDHPDFVLTVPRVARNGQLILPGAPSSPVKNSEAIEPSP